MSGFSNIKIAVSYLTEHKVLVAINLAVLLGVSLSEGVGVGMIIPILQSIGGQGFGGSSLFIDYTKAVLNLVHIPYGFSNLMLIFIVFLVLKFALTAFQQHYARVLSASIILDLRKKAFDNLMRLPVSFFHQRKLGDLISTVHISSLNAGGMLENVVNLFVSAAFIFVYGAISIMISWQMSVIALFVGLITYIWIIPRFREINRRGQEEKRLTDVITSFLLDKMGGIKIVKAFHNESLHAGQFRSIIGDYKEMQIQIMMSKIMANLLFEPLVTLAIVILVFFAVQYLQMPILSLLVFFYILRMVFPRFKTLNSQYMAVMEFLPHFSKIQGLIDTHDKQYLAQGRESMETLREGIAFKDVWFNYPSSEEHILKNINVQIPKNQTVAVVGESGGGKSTLASLIMRLYDPIRGTVAFDGVDTREIDPASLNRLIGFVDQDPYLFHDSIFNNILYGKLDAQESEVIDAARLAHAHDFIDQLPQKYHTIVGERGVRLSGGQRQRISLARALIRNPEILILDEATSSLDSESEQMIQDSIMQLAKKKTIIIIAHRLSTIRHADKIVVVENGEIVEAGRHEELMQASGVYKKYHTLQQK